MSTTNLRAFIVGLSRNEKLASRVNDASDCHHVTALMTLGSTSDDREEGREREASSGKRCHFHYEPPTQDFGKNAMI
jgi:hypothetical protein